MSATEKRALVLDLLKVVRRPDLALTNPQRSVLIILADYGCNETTYHPSITALEVATTFDRRTVTRALAELEETGWIVRHRNPPAATQYTLASERIRSLAAGYIDDPKSHHVGRAPRGTTPLGAQDPQGTTPLEQGQRAPRLGAEDPTARGPVPPESPKPNEAPPSPRAREAARGTTPLAKAGGREGPRSGVKRGDPEACPAPTDPAASDWLATHRLPALDSDDGKEVARFLAYHSAEETAIKHPRGLWGAWTEHAQFEQNSGAYKRKAPRPKVAPPEPEPARPEPTDEEMRAAALEAQRLGFGVPPQFRRFLPTEESA